jgi:hypothetical protein
VAREEGPPLAVPVWYGYEPGGDVVVQMDDTSVKRRLIDRAGEFSLATQDETPPYRYVTVQGPVVGTRVGVSPADAEALARRYLDADDLAGYLASADPDRMVEVRMRPDRWYAVEL